MRPEFDARDQEILEQRQKLFDEREGPRVGDYVLMLDGSTRRFTHDWGDDIQTTSHTYSSDASFYLSDGYMSFSGSLNPAIPKAGLVLLDEIRTGGCWFFHHNYPTGGGGVYTDVMCRVFKQTEAAK